MFKKIYSTIPIPYEPWDGTLPSFVYYDELITPPKHYIETLYFPFSIINKKEATRNGPSTITLLAATNIIQWPSYSYESWTFDGVTGDLVTRNEISGTVYTGILHLESLTEGFDGSIWGAYVTGAIKEFSSVGNGIDSVGDSILLSHFEGASDTKIPLVDKVADIVIMPGSLSKLRVYALSSGTLQKIINVGGSPIAICAEDGKRLYVLGSNFILNLVDYSTGEVINSYKCPSSPLGTSLRLAWDRVFRRLLIYDQVPDAVDGSSLTRIVGYYPIPLATHITAPIPLKVSRKGRTVPVLIRVVGDVGEPITGAQCNVTVSGDGIIERAPIGSDNNGDLFLSLLCVNPGTVTVTVSTTVDDGL